MPEAEPRRTPVPLPISKFKPGIVDQALPEWELVRPSRERLWYFHPKGVSFHERQLTLDLRPGSGNRIDVITGENDRLNFGFRVNGLTGFTSYQVEPNRVTFRRRHPGEEDRVEIHQDGTVKIFWKEDKIRIADILPPLNYQELRRRS